MVIEINFLLSIPNTDCYVEFMYKIQVRLFITLYLYTNCLDGPPSPIGKSELWTRLCRPPRLCTTRRRRRRWPRYSCRTSSLRRPVPKSPRRPAVCRRRPACRVAAAADAYRTSAAQSRSPLRRACVLTLPTTAVSSRFRFVWQFFREPVVHRPRLIRTIFF